MGFTASAVLIVTLYLIINIWRKIANGHQRIFWHSKLFESIFVVSTVCIIILGSVSCILLKAVAPTTFMYGSATPPELVLTNLHM